MKKIKLSPDVEDLQQSSNRNSEQKRKEKRKALIEKLWNHPKIILSNNTSSLNYEPFPEGAFERFQQCKIWGSVLAFLKETNDVKSAYYACGTFGLILREPQKLMIMALPLVLQNIRSNIGQYYSDDRLGYLRRRKVWDRLWPNMRAVCKSWKDIVDFEYTDFSHESWFLNMGWIDRRLQIKFLDFTTDEEIEEAAYALNSFHVSASLVRNWIVSMTKDHVRLPQGFFREIVDLLRVHGRHVRFYSLQWDCRENILDIYSRLGEMLVCMPNLKALDMCLMFSTGNENGVEFQNFWRRFNQNLIPTFNALRYFRCSNAINSSQLFQILKHCVNLRSLDYICCECESVDANEVNEGLTLLKLERYCGCFPLLNAITSKSNQSVWPLRILSIDSWKEAVAASKVIPVINRFRETLEHLYVNGGIEKDVTNVLLDLPRLKALIIEPVGNPVVKDGIDFDDLLLLTSLEKVILKIQAEFTNENPKVEIQKYLESGEMEKSNVWQHFPNLKYFEVECELLGRGKFKRPAVLHA